MKKLILSAMCLAFLPVGVLAAYPNKGSDDIKVKAKLNKEIRRKVKKAIEEKRKEHFPEGKEKDVRK